MMVDIRAMRALNPGDFVNGVAADTGIGVEVGAEVGGTLVVTVGNAEVSRSAFDRDDAVGIVDCDKMELSVVAVMLLSKSSSSDFDGDNAMGTVDSDKVELSVATVTLLSKSSPWGVDVGVVRSGSSSRVHCPG